MNRLEQQDVNDLYKLIAVLILLIIVAFIVGYFRGKEDIKAEIEYRAMKIQTEKEYNKKAYTNKDIDIIVFGESQE